MTVKVLTSVSTARPIGPCVNGCAFGLLFVTFFYCNLGLKMIQTGRVCCKSVLRHQNQKRTPSTHYGFLKSVNMIKSNLHSLANRKSAAIFFHYPSTLWPCP